MNETKFKQLADANDERIRMLGYRDEPEDIKSIIGE